MTSAEAFCGSCSLGKSCRTATSGAGWWLTYPSEKDESQFGWLFPTEWKNKKCSKPPTRVCPVCPIRNATKCDEDEGPWSLVTLSSGHLWPYHPVTCDPIIPGHLRPYYPVTCDPIPLITLTPPAFHHTSVSILLLYLNFPPCVPLYHCLHSTSLFKLPPLRSTKPLSPFYFCF